MDNGTTFSSQTLTDEDFDAVFAGRPGGFITLNSVKSAPLALRALARCRELGIPSVAYGNGPDLQGYDRVYSDHRAGSRDLTRWLLSRGCRRIVPFLPFAPTRFWEQERIEGYREAMREAGLEPLPCTVFSSPAVLMPQDAEYFHINAALALSKLVALRREGVGPDALLCLNDDWAKPALAAIRDLGLVPNRDILIAGYDNMARNSGYDAFEPGRPVVTVDKHNERSSEDLAALIVAHMDGTLPPEPQARIHAHDAVIFQSEAAVRDLLAPFWGMDRARTVGLSYWGAIEYWGESPGWPAKGWTHSFFDHDLTPRPSAWLLKSAFLPDEPLVRLAVFGGGPWRTNYVKCWLQELGVKRQYLLDHDVVFE